MRKKVKRMLALGIAGVMMGALAACGSSADNKDDQASSVPADSTSVEKSADGAADAPVTLKFSWWGNQNRHDYTQRILDKYTELHPNVTFEAMPSGWDGYFDKLSTQAASGSMPDIVQMDYLYITTYAKNNSLEIGRAHV